jgi:hypothetical protein
MNYKKRYKKGNYRMFLAGGTDDSRANALNMYNTGQIGSGGATVGSTSNIVEQESNPELQEARLQNLTEQQKLLLQQQQQVEAQASQQATEDEIVNEQKLAEFNASQEAQQQQQSAAANTALKQGVKLYNPEAFAQHNLDNANAYSQLGSDVIQGFKNMKPITQYAELPSTVANAGLTMPSTSGITLSGVPAKAPMSGFSLGADNLAANLGTNTVTSSGLSTIPAASTTVPVGTMAGTGFKAGLSQVGAGIGNFAKSAPGIGTIASLAGEGIYRLADDKDATTLTFGEGSGKVLKGVGSGLATGAMIGSAVGGPLAPISGTIGAVIGGGVALGKSLTNRNKARKEKDTLESEAISNRNVGINRFNEDLTSKYGSALSSIRQGELAQKSISGQDLGYNLVAREGGVRKFANGGTDPRLLARQQQADLEKQKQLQIGGRLGSLQNQMLNPRLGLARPGMNIMQQFQNPNVSRIGSRIGGGVLGNVANNFGQSVNPNAAPLYGPGFRNGGMRMGMPRYGYAV